jgi:hypothetical protein
MMSVMMYLQLMCTVIMAKYRNQRGGNTLIDCFGHGEWGWGEKESFQQTFLRKMK